MNTATVLNSMPRSGRASCSVPPQSLRSWPTSSLFQRLTCSISDRKCLRDSPTEAVSFTTPSSTTSCTAALWENTQTLRCSPMKCCSLLPERYCYCYCSWFCMFDTFAIGSFFTLLPRVCRWHHVITDFNLLLKVRVPDVEFYINVGDWPLETRKTDPVPVLSWCGSTETRDIVLPTYEVTHSTLETMRGVTNDLLSVQGNTGNARAWATMRPALVKKWGSGTQFWICLCMLPIISCLNIYMDIKWSMQP